MDWTTEPELTFGGMQEGHEIRVHRVSSIHGTTILRSEHETKREGPGVREEADAVTLHLTFEASLTRRSGVVFGARATSSHQA